MSDITGPGEDPTVRLVMSVRIDTGSTMKLETGEAAQVLYVELDGRGLGDVADREKRTYVMERGQAAWLAGQIMGVLSRGEQ